MSSSSATRARARRAASSIGESPRRAKTSDADSSPQAKTCSSSESASVCASPSRSDPVSDAAGTASASRKQIWRSTDRAMVGLTPADVTAEVSASSWVGELGDHRPIPVAFHDVAGLVEGPQCLREEAVVQIELVVDDCPLVGVDVGDLVQ